MEKISRDDEKMELPPGFRFHPTDEELITHYLSHKVLDTSFHAIAIGEVDLNKCEPWDLPWNAKIGEKEWYFFYLRDRKYPTGQRTNRATEAGYWKATGKDKEIYRAKPLEVVGMKKTLVFYKGRAPRGEKTNWVMHEYRLEGNSSKNEWVICRVFQKSPGGKKAYTSGEASRVTCFSHPPTEDDDIIHDNPPPAVHVHNTIYAPNLHYPDSISVQQQSMLGLLYESRINNNVNVQSVNVKTSEEELSAETGDLSTDISSVVSNHDLGQRSFHEPPTSAGPVHLDCLWNY